MCVLAGVGEKLEPGDFLAVILLIFSNKAAEKLASHFLEANLLSPGKRKYYTDEVPFGPIAAAASTLIKGFVSRSKQPAQPPSGASSFASPGTPNTPAEIKLSRSPS